MYYVVIPPELAEPPRTAFALHAAILFAVALSAALGSAGELPSAPATIRVDFADTVGAVRPLHGVNGGPLCRGGTVDLTEYWREAKIPLARLHDCEWPRPDLVDLRAVFPNPNADPHDPASYDFATTDDYLAAVVASGARPVYRLGESIEHTPRKYRVHPPADPDRWAAACVGVIRHYDEGWANGFRHGITHWEIWNEPENRPACWTGTDEDYYRLYASAAKAIKSRFPSLKVGGPASGSVGEVKDGRLVPTPLVAGLLRHCREQSLPLDFFSWHHYTDEPADYVTRAHAVRHWLDEAGFEQTEIHLNEWNYLPGKDWSPVLPTAQGEPRRRWAGRMSGVEGAAFAACVLCDLQDAPVDAANFFRGDSGGFGLFDEYGTPTKAYFAFRAFGILTETPLRVRVKGAEAGKAAACAGLNAEESAAAVLISNYRSHGGRFELSLGGLPWRGSTDWEVSVLDASRDVGRAAGGRAASPPETLSLELRAPAVALVQLRRATDQKE